ncbi:unnamed protein product [Angiostrongylus costaricensis]|uniref:Gag-pol polyprotein n=1 Tax=Angiostrongylus costaricensis TaxID=334426 RepID=A0A0R3PSV3_ANGCS|nr:unnamed protein product [Angiostrongylus costaricensis]
MTYERVARHQHDGKPPTNNENLFAGLRNDTMNSTVGQPNAIPVTLISVLEGIPSVDDENWDLATVHERSSLEASFLEYMEKVQTDQKK